jgi:hypothetical protein
MRDDDGPGPLTHASSSRADEMWLGWRRRFTRLGTYD